MKRLDISIPIPVVLNIIKHELSMHKMSSRYVHFADLYDKFFYIIVLNFPARC